MRASNRRITRILGLSRQKGSQSVTPERPKPSPMSKPVEFQGHKTAGTPTLGELQKAAKTETLKVNQKGFAVTPKVQRVGGELRRAKAIVRKSGPNLSGLSPAEREVARLDIQAHQKYPEIPVSVLMGDTKQESNFNAGAKSEAGAQGLTQFIPSTAAQYGVKYGTSKAAKRSQVMGQAHYLSNLKREHGSIEAALNAYYGRQGEPYAGEVLSKAAEYEGLNKPGNPRARKKLKLAEVQARALGLHGPKRFRYANPLPESAWSPGRSDQGYDAAPRVANAPVLAVSRGKVIATGAPGWPEGGGVTYKILQGPQRGKEIYAFEGLNATVKPGQIVKKGQTIAVGRQGGSIETGYYVGNQTVGGHPLNNTTIGGNQVYSVASTDGQQTIGSAEFEKQILGKSVAVPASGGSPGYYVTGPTVTAYAEATGQPPAKVAHEIKTRALSPMQIFKELRALGVHTALEKPKQEEERKPSVSISDLEKKYG